MSNEKPCIALKFRLSLLDAPIKAIDSAHMFNLTSVENKAKFDNIKSGIDAMVHLFGFDPAKFDNSVVGWAIISTEKPPVSPMEMFMYTRLSEAYGLMGRHLLLPYDLLKTLKEGDVITPKFDTCMLQPEYDYTFTITVNQKDGALSNLGDFQTTLAKLIQHYRCGDEYINFLPVIKADMTVFTGKAINGSDISNNERYDVLDVYGLKSESFHEIMCDEVDILNRVDDTVDGIDHRDYYLPTFLPSYLFEGNPEYIELVYKNKVRIQFKVTYDCD